MKLRRKKNGYSLIEVLLATAIFGMVLMVGTSSFTAVNRVAREARIYQELSQTGIFVSETLASSIRNATGEKNENNKFTKIPFRLEEESGEDCFQSLTTYRAENGEVKERKFYSAEEQGENIDFMLSINNAEDSMLPSNIVLDKPACFSGIDYTSNTNAQPYVIFEFTLKNLDSGRTKTFRSATAGQEYF